MKNNNGKPENKRPDEEMMEKILRYKCGNRETDEFAADSLELEELYSRNKRTEPDNDEDSEYAEDLGIGESKYFSTCDFTMINDDEDSVNYQGS